MNWSLTHYTTMICRKLWNNVRIPENYILRNTSQVSLQRMFTTSNHEYL